MFRFLFIFAMSTSTFLAAPAEPRTFQRPLVFEPNRGQAPAAVKWIARGNGYNLFLNSDGATIMLPDHREQAPAKTPVPEFVSPQRRPGISQPDYSTVKMKLTGARPWTAMEGLEPTGGRSNYLLGSDPNLWRTDIPHYNRVTAAGVYEGIDLVLYSKGGDLEYDFVVAPEADPKQIRLAFDGVDRMRVDRTSGDLILTTAGGSELRHIRPKVYQDIENEHVEVAGGYEILDRRQATFTLASYDRQRPLVIDPVVSFSTYMQGNGEDFASSIATDSSGTYVTGYTVSTDFASPGALQGDQPTTDAFVFKLNAKGLLMFSTYLGGRDTDSGAGIAVDSTGVYVAGSTWSPDFPTRNPIFSYHQHDAFVSKLSLAGNSFLFSTFLGGSSFDYAGGIALDSTHAAWVVGSTLSTDFPIAGGPSLGQQRIHGGHNDAFLARIAPSGTSLAFSTFAGGVGDDYGFAVAVDTTGSVYATGAGATDFPITTGMRPCGTTGGAFAVRLKGPGTQTRYATCIPNGQGFGIAVDASFNAYLTGMADENFPATPGSFQPTKPTVAGLPVGFVTKLGTLGNVVFSTYLGGKSSYSVFQGVAVTPTGTPYVVGRTYSKDFPGLPDWQPPLSAGILCKLTPQGNALSYALRLGSTLEAVSLFRLNRLSPQQIYAAGIEYTNTYTDAMVAKVVEEGSLPLPGGGGTKAP